MSTTPIKLNVQVLHFAPETPIKQKRRILRKKAQQEAQKAFDEENARPFLEDLEDVERLTKKEKQEEKDESNHLPFLEDDVEETKAIRSLIKQHHKREKQSSDAMVEFDALKYTIGNIHQKPISVVPGIQVNSNDGNSSFTALSFQFKAELPGDFEEIIIIKKKKEH